LYDADLIQAREIYKVMTEEGLIMAINVILSRLTNPNTPDILNPLLREVLGIIEDLSSFDEEEEQALLSAGIVARLISLLQLSTSVLGEVTDPHAGIYIFGLFRTSITILSNLC
jgi:hypothetical protein